MGKAIPKIVKHRARELIELYPDKFSGEFAKNKDFIKELNLSYSTLELNLMAGYISRLCGKKS